ncbi:cyclopropane-fatty-acyl-phospholipid synthase [Halanaerobium saccharolyticum]|uniref:Cyclopropane-fatty-acyl-phospholipid synthase n=1 Tax=Halanaerobium saccharolyticum TaxID=43595 RepID=A0A4R7Z8X0_9FIRM|nr:class I SAM-dependent methyltransferase [Halanaerobium saccharolyticum]RAK09305.1 cyclopropane-fatty-acyl-phospholipid synthase [Halanaerobium saccharolyticum]TDW06164.1 cyclopropane-fatty-acyl-phospholipid synthase [Halanaerobium saccharolyticum]TDX60958.1 cyclopropane-fatty-acyl-phospholipid synthase [Halanaerobium saccharolyticum]
MNLDKLLAQGTVPDFLLRKGIRRQINKRIKKQKRLSIEGRFEYLSKFIENLKKQPIAVETEAANEQHYELPPQFFEKILGRNLKYSCCFWSDDFNYKKLKKQGDLQQRLDQAEAEMLELTAHRAEIENGQNILDLGSGWGSLSFYLAKKFPDSRIISISNSSLQIEYINQLAAQNKIENLRAVKADISDFKTEAKFERIVSVEMFEHLRNYQKLMQKLSSFLSAEGKLFVHIFSHQYYPFTYQDNQDTDWMARYFFSGGTMPSQDLLHYFSGNLNLQQQWAISGSHYQKTLEVWLKIMDQKKEEIYPILESNYGVGQAEKWWNYWRVFFISSAEFFGFDAGNEWFISHYLFQK